MNGCAVQISLAATTCMFVASTALARSTSPSNILDACIVIGTVGTLFAGAAASLSASGKPRAATRTLLLSSGCAVSGAVCMIAATQTWKATMLAIAAACVALAVVLRATLKREKAVDADALV